MYRKYIVHFDPQPGMYIYIRYYFITSYYVASLIERIVNDCDFHRMISYIHTYQSCILFI